MTDPLLWQQSGVNAKVEEDKVPKVTQIKPGGLEFRKMHVLGLNFSIRLWDLRHFSVCQRSAPFHLIVLRSNIHLEQDTRDGARIPGYWTQSVCAQRRNEGGKMGAIPRVPNHYGGAESLQWAPKNLNNVASTFSMQYICFRKISGSNMGAPNLLLAPGAV